MNDPQLLHFWKNTPPLALLMHRSLKTLTEGHPPVFLIVGGGTKQDARGVVFEVAASRRLFHDEE